MTSNDIYLDYNATTPLDSRVLEAMDPYLRGEFGNAASHHHGFGRRAAEAVDRARKQVAAVIAADPRETRSIADDFGPAAEIVRAEAGTRGVAFRSEFRGVGPQVEEQLRALGYLELSAEHD